MEQNIEEHLNMLCFEGAEQIYGSPLPDMVTERLNYELAVISNMEFAGFFIAVHDFVNTVQSGVAL